MKLLTLSLIALSVSAVAQTKAITGISTVTTANANTILSYAQKDAPCPVVMPDTLEQKSQWQTINKINPSKNPVWVLDERFQEKIYTTPAIYCPCGCNWPVVEFQNRIDKNSGCIQQQRITIGWITAPSPKTYYQIVTDSIAKAKLKNP